MDDRQVVWRFADAEVDENAIADVEKELGIKFPQDYIDCAKKNHGGNPNPNLFVVTERGEAVFNVLLSYAPTSVDYIVKVYGWIKDRLVDGVYPFADDPFGNHICFDYRTSNEPTIVFWDHELVFEEPEKGLFPICNSFSELLAGLYPDNDLND